MATAKTAAPKKKTRPAGVRAEEGIAPKMTPLASPPAHRVILHGIRWATYESLLKDLENSSAPRLTYDRGTLEIMSPLPDHETLNRNLAMLVEIVAEARGLDVWGVGSTTFTREDLERGFEPDSCFYIWNAELMRSKSRIDLTIDPPPDLVIEIDLTHSTLDKLSIYAQLGAPEVWRYAGTSLLILILREGTYHEQGESAALPGLDSAGMAALLEEAPSLRRPEWLRKVREWELAHRPQG
jgi:Uma2 family endonuclease